MDILYYSFCILLGLSVVLYCLAEAALSNVIIFNRQTQMLPVTKTMHCWKLSASQLKNEAVRKNQGILPRECKMQTLMLFNNHIHWYRHIWLRLQNNSTHTPSRQSGMQNMNYMQLNEDLRVICIRHRQPKHGCQTVIILHLSHITWMHTMRKWSHMMSTIYASNCQQLCPRLFHLREPRLDNCVDCFVDCFASRFGQC